ncbi:MAG: YciI family protein [Candidatus Binataceae bacterium]|jgi:uncharacterized protein YciI
MSEAASGSWYLYQIFANRLEMLRSGPTPAEASVLQQHRSYLQGLAERGVLGLAGRTMNNDETTFGIAIIRAASEDEARALMENDPFIKSGIAHARLFPFHPAFSGRF